MKANPLRRVSPNTRRSGPLRREATLLLVSCRPSWSGRATHQENNENKGFVILKHVFGWTAGYETAANQELVCSITIKLNNADGCDKLWPDGPGHCFTQIGSISNKKRLLNPPIVNQKNNSSNKFSHSMVPKILDQTGVSIPFHLKCYVFRVSTWPLWSRQNQLPPP